MTRILPFSGADEFHHGSDSGSINLVEVFEFCHTENDFVHQLKLLRIDPARKREKSDIGTVFGGKGMLERLARLFAPRVARRNGK